MQMNRETRSLAPPLEISRARRACLSPPRRARARRAALAIAAAAALALALPACGIDTGDAAGGDAPTYYADVKPILDAKCNGCHTAGGAAPFALTTYAEASASAGRIVDAVKSRRMPPWQPEASCAKIVDQESWIVEPAQIETLERWMKAGAPAGDPASAPKVPARSPDPSTTAGPPDIVLDPGGEYDFANRADDEYRCFRLDRGATGAFDLVGMDIEPGNRAIVHHVIVFRERNGAGKPTGLPGFTCNAIPRGGEFVFGWVPGTTPQMLPPGMGMRIAATDALVMQVHYHRSSSPNARDRTRLKLYTAKQPVREQVRVVWTGSIGIDVDPGQRQTVSGQCEVPAGAAPVKLIGVGPHMHQAGRTFRSRIERGARSAAGTGETCVVDIPRWDFEWQGTYQFAEPIMLYPGDKIHTECSYMNDTNKHIGFGEGTGDEMCFQFNFVADDGKTPDLCFSPCNSIPGLPWCEWLLGL